MRGQSELFPKQKKTITAWIVEVVVTVLLWLDITVLPVNHDLHRPSIFHWRNVAFTAAGNNTSGRNRGAKQNMTQRGIL